MTGTLYEPERAPDPREWLALDESERIRLVKNYHVAARIKTEKLKLHALYHMIVENQIATGFGPTCHAVKRLQKEKLTRHDALHVVASVIAQFMHDSMRGKVSASVQHAQQDLNARIEALTADSWRKS